MKIIDADKFLGYLIFSKHIDGLTCGEVKEAVEMCKVDEVKADDVLDKIRAEIAENGNSDINAQTVLAIIDKYRGTQNEQSID